MSDEYSKSGYDSGQFQQNQSQERFTSSQHNAHSSPGYQQRNTAYNQGSSGQSNGFSNFRGGTRRFAPKAPRDFSVDPPFLYKPYVATGNQDTPAEVVEQFKVLRDRLDFNHYTVRTSAFDGLDKIAMEAKNKEVILPWREFAGHPSKLTFTPEEAKYFAKQTFSNYDNMKDTVKTFLAKNVRLVFGQNLKSPALFLLLWSADGCESLEQRTPQTGNIGHLITLANEIRIPVFNLGKPDASKRLLERFPLKQAIPT